MAYDTWQDETTLELLWNGYELIEKRLDCLEKELQTTGQLPTSEELQTASQPQLAEENETFSTMPGTGVTSKPRTRKSAEWEAIRKLRRWSLKIQP